MHTPRADEIRLAGSVRTVLGDTSTRELGRVSMHEHVLVDSRGRSSGPRPDDWEQPIALDAHARIRSAPRSRAANLVLDAHDAPSELAALRSSGGGALLDVTAVGMRGTMRELPKLSRSSSVHIVASTGFYVEESWPSAVVGWNRKRRLGFMRNELSDRITDTEFRAGHVKAALSTCSDAELETLTAAAEAAAEGGVSLTVHPSFTDPAGPARIVDLVESAGLSADRLVIAHCDGFITELDFHKLVKDPTTWGLRLDVVEGLLARGVVVSFDCFGHEWGDRRWVESDWQRLSAVYHLIAAGHARQIVLSCDVAKRSLTRRYGGHGYSRVLDWAVPTLVDLGVSLRDIDAMLVETPARILRLT